MELYIRYFTDLISKNCSKIKYIHNIFEKKLLKIANYLKISDYELDILRKELKKDYFDKIYFRQCNCNKNCRKYICCYRSSKQPLKYQDKVLAHKTFKSCLKIENNALKNL